MKHRMPGTFRLALCTLISLLLGSAAHAAGRAGEPDILKPEQAFRYTTSATADEVVVRWTIEPAHYLYRERMSYESRTPGITLGSAVIPAGTPHNDEYFGQMHIFRDQLEVRLPVSDRPPGAVSLTLAIKSQGCADIGLCYPPQVWLANVELPAAAAAAASSTAAPGRLGALLNRLPRSASDEPLPVAQAFPLDAVLGDDFTLQIRWNITPGYYLYRHTLKASTSSESVQLGPPSLPAGTAMQDEAYGDTLVFHEPVTMTVPLIRRGPAAVSLPLSIEYQGCKLDSICYPPQRVQVSLELPAISTDQSGAATPAPPTEAEQDRLYTVIRDGNLLAVMAMFAGFGLLLSFTPCCLPMYPILSGIIVGQSGTEGDGAQKRGTARSFLLSVAFVLGMAVTYTALGAIFAAAGAQVQAVMQKPAVTIGVALLFVALALSMFGLFDLQIPSSWQTRLNALSGRQRSGQLLGAGVMGMISAAVVTTCVTPPLVAALTVIARTGDLTRGALALFALAIGMGIPLLAIGASAGHLMPKTGAWMNSVKAIFGLMMLGMAVWMLDRLWSGTVTMALWGILLVTASILLGTFTQLDGRATLKHKLGKGLGVIVLLYGLVLLLGAFGGSKDPSQPLGFLRGAAPRSGDSHAESSPLSRIKTSADLDAQLARATAAGKPVMLDFYADWCVSCKELEKYTFSDPVVRKELENAIALQADVTAMDADDQVLMKRFGIIGPPTIVFFSAGGSEQAAFRVVGFMKAEAFATHLRDAFATPSKN
ncbi:MAG: protein-disulfide reductase DsbD [Chromatiales bacterium]|jgi:thiol:disulfide interchange protein DsbD|nr:protein-disulfide reductase DsbD [Chromatiales bacterium]